MERKTSVIFLPGIMGSRLYFPKSEQFWDPDSPARMLGWVPTPLLRSSDYLREQVHVREPAGVLIDPVATSLDDWQVEHGWGTVSWNFYGDFLTDLANRFGRNVHAVGYDWRQSLRRLGEYVCDKIRRIRESESTERFIIVTHSMGGLVARAAFATDPALRDSVAGVVYVCQPAVGSITLYRRMFTGLVPEFDATLLSENDSTGKRIASGLFDRLFALILGGTRSDFLGKISGMPGALSFLPNDHFPNPEGAAPWLPEMEDTKTTEELYLEAVSPPGLVPSGKDRLSPVFEADLKARLKDFFRTQKFLKPPGDPATHHEKTWLIYGTGLPTETRVVRHGRKFVPGKTEDGDGTVPAVSATAVPVQQDRRIPIHKLEHSQAFSKKSDPGRKCVAEAIELVERIAKEDAIAMARSKAAASPDSFQILGEMTPERQERKLRELYPEEAVSSSDRVAATSFGLGDDVRDMVKELVSAEVPWKYKGLQVGFVPSGDHSTREIAILPFVEAPRSPHLMSVGLKVTLDRLYTANYPGSGTHHVMFRFSTSHSVDGGEQKEDVHYAAIYETQDGSAARKSGVTIFRDLSVAKDSLQMKVSMTNVKNQRDYAMLSFLKEPAFQQGLQLFKKVHPAVGQISTLAKTMFDVISDFDRKGNYGVFDFELGLHFDAASTHGRLAEGSYVVIQYPEKKPDMDWSGIVFDTHNQRVIAKSEPEKPYPYNYVILNISAMEKPAGS